MEIIGIMGAMPDEVEQLCALLDGVTIEPYAGVEYHRGMLGDKPTTPPRRRRSSCTRWASRPPALTT